MRLFNNNRNGMMRKSVMVINNDNKNILDGGSDQKNSIERKYELVIDNNGAIITQREQKYMQQDAKNILFGYNT